MRRFLYGILLGLICFGPVGAKTYTDKTFITPRSHNENMAMEYTGWHKQFRRIGKEKLGGYVQATGFYQQSTNDKELGKYFGKYNSATLSPTNLYSGKIQDFIWVKTRPAVVANSNNERLLLLDPRHIFHDYVTDITTDATRINVQGRFRPKQTSYGVTLDYHQKLDKLAKGLYFKVSMPFVHVKNDLNFCVTGDVTTQKFHVSNNTKVSLADYLSGNFSNTDDPNRQEKLKYAKICGAQTKTGIADIDLMLGYNFMYKEHKHFNANISLKLPTTSAPNGEWLFEPILGHAGHCALGVGVDGAFEIWQSGNMSLEYVGAANYKYIFGATEKRTLGFRYRDQIYTDADPGVLTNPYLVAGRRVPMGWYMLGGQHGEKGLFPLANVLTRKVSVEPGSQFEMLSSLAFNWRKLTIDFGYNLFAKEAETVKCQGCFDDNVYGIASWAYTTANAFLYYYDAIDGSLDPIATVGYNTRTGIHKQDLIERDAASPVYVTHKVFGGVSYMFDKWDYPIMAGIGGSWEFVQGGNTALDGYAVWAKVGIGF